MQSMSDFRDCIEFDLQSVEELSVLDCLKWEHEEFVNEIFLKLKLHFQLSEDKYLPTCLFATNNITCAVLIISSLFRKHYRVHYIALRKQFHKVEEFQKFCSFVIVSNTDFHFFQFLRRLSYLFELCLYLLKEGYDYFSVACKSIQDNLDLEFFKEAGAWETLEEVSIYVMGYFKCNPEIYTVHPLLGNFIEIEENANNPNGIINWELINKSFHAPPISNSHCNHLEKMVEEFVLHKQIGDIIVEICSGQQCTLSYGNEAINMYLETLCSFPEIEELSENVQISADESLENDEENHPDSFVEELLKTLNLKDTYLNSNAELFKCLGFADSEEEEEEESLPDDNENNFHEFVIPKFSEEEEEESLPDDNENNVHEFVIPKFSEEEEEFRKSKETLPDAEENFVHEFVIPKFSEEEEEFRKSKETLPDAEANYVHEFVIPIHDICKQQFRDDASLPEFIPLPDKHIKIMMEIINFVSSLSKKDKIEITEVFFTPPYTADQTVVMELMDTIPDHPALERSDLLNTFRNLEYLSIKDKNNLYNRIIMDSQYTSKERNELLIALSKIPDTWEDKMYYLTSVITKIDCPRYVKSQLISGMSGVKNIIWDDDEIRLFPVINPNDGDILLPKSVEHGEDQLKSKRSLPIYTEEECSLIEEEMKALELNVGDVQIKYPEKKLMKEVDMMYDKFQKPVTTFKMDYTNLRKNLKLCEMQAASSSESTKEFAAQMKPVDMMHDKFKKSVTAFKTDDGNLRENSKLREMQAASSSKSTKQLAAEMKKLERICDKFQMSVTACKTDYSNLREKSKLCGMQAASSSESRKEMTSQMKNMSLTGAIPKRSQRSIKNAKNIKNKLYGRNVCTGG